MNSTSKPAVTCAGVLPPSVTPSAVAEAVKEIGFTPRFAVANSTTERFWLSHTRAQGTEGVALSFAPGQGWTPYLPAYGYGAVGGWSAAVAYIMLLGIMLMLRWRSGAWRRIDLKFSH